MFRLSIIVCLLALLTACNTEIEQERNCRYTTDGWVCRDAGNSNNGGADEDMQSDDIPNAPDMTTGDDMQTNPGVADMAAEEDMASETASSCAELLLRGESTGQHTIELEGTSTDVYCDMDTANGGWMLVARSATGGTAANFGWRNATGSLGDTGQPYSLAPVGFDFTEILVGAHDGDYTLGDRSYRLGNINDFWASCETAACDVSVTPEAGNCNDIVMLSFAGHNDETDRFFFRDLAEISTQGLHPDGFQVFYDDCRGGELQGRQGMIFVR